MTYVYQSTADKHPNAISIDLGVWYSSQVEKWVWDVPTESLFSARARDRNDGNLRRQEHAEDNIVFVRKPSTHWMSQGGHMWPQLLFYKKQ